MTVLKDCAGGAIPPLGPAYGMKAILDDGLIGLSEVYFEGGDHEELVRVDGEQFLRLLKEVQHGQFGHLPKLPSRTGGGVAPEAKNSGKT